MCWAKASFAPTGTARIPRLKIRVILRAKASFAPTLNEDDDAVNVIRHHDERIEGQVWESFR